MRDEQNRKLAFLLMGLFLLGAVVSTRGEHGLYIPRLDSLAPVLRPLGNGKERAYSFVLPSASYFGSLAAEPPASNNRESRYRIVIDPEQRSLTLYSSGQELKTYPLAVGKPGTPTPVGEWLIIYKSVNWGGGFGTRWLGLNVPWGIYGIHGTNKPHSIGTRASGGCIRMFNRDVEELFSLVNVGTRVDVVGAWPDVTVSRTLQSGTTGRDVQLLQRSLRRVGLEIGRLDGRFGPQTEYAVRELEQFYSLGVDGIADYDVLMILNIK